jgi:two-component system, sporulation sensor kinase D
MSKNKTWRRLLIAILVIVLLFSLLYTLGLVKHVSKKEKENARIWIQTIQQQRKLISDIEVLFNNLDQEEQNKLRLWAKAIKRLPLIENDDKDFNIIFELVKNNESIPAILTDQRGNILYSRNIKESYQNQPTSFVLKQMKNQYRPIKINQPDGSLNYLYYSQSKIHQDINVVFDELINTYLNDIENNLVSVPVLYMDSTKTKVLAYGNLNANPKNTTSENSIEKQIELLKNSVTPVPIGEDFLYIEESKLLLLIKFFPVIFIILVFCFALVLYFYLNTSEQYERNFLWVGMSKETAHQLGTPISSLMAWTEILKEEYQHEVGFQEIQKDIDRLELIADRFSKIGSRPKLETGELSNEIDYILSYMKPRISPHVEISVIHESNNLFALYNKQLIGWVIENLLKNAVDAMSGKGKLNINLVTENNKVILEITDTGIGIKKSHFQKVFKAGYTSKKRGWGLGLALARRIIEEYHNGKIFVKSSKSEFGTTMRIELRLLKKLKEKSQLK